MLFSGTSLSAGDEVYYRDEDTVTIYVKFKNIPKQATTLKLSHEGADGTYLLFSLFYIIT